jgi:hypothetical protein
MNAKLRVGAYEIKKVLLNNVLGRYDGMPKTKDESNSRRNYNEFQE